ncbi:hypothetical protein SCP_1203010 [Sparassis crispa]|uniref:Uncharacterized protein n=1 Tax=Sparassis crispa TaxID=139825 RepID=A0A401H0Z2_9APHY|nr:hypothetical protein SCP_1203010 [Sparassis crispa]GBE88072.1 hypothetical protein SCP_1203010 [Sparassis crispa]
MIGHFPSPILSVTADAVQELEGEDAVFGLWALFTKCKESLKDGRRLENMSWRLWYREIAASQHSPCSSPGTMTPASCERSSPPITPISEDGRVSQDHAPDATLAPASGFPVAHSWHGEKPAPSFIGGRRLSSASVPMASKSHGAVHVGKLILGILPDKVVVPVVRLPSPPATHQVLPTVQLPDAPSPAPPSAAYPRVVVVNPTPHPTPPATPHLSHTPQAIFAAQPSLNLLPPPPARPLTSVLAPAQGKKQSVSRQSDLQAPRDVPPSQPDTRDDTLKPSDRRFFMQEAESPDRDSLESTSRATSGKFSVGHEMSPGSVSSNQTKSDGGGAASSSGGKRGLAGRSQGRKSKEAVRYVATRPAVHRTHAPAHQQHHPSRQTAQRKAATESKKTTFNFGSVSSNGSRGAEPGPSKAPAAPNEPSEPVVTRPCASPPKQTNGVAQPPRRGIVVSTSSDYETTDTDDDSEWASEDNSTGEREKERQREETRLREAAEEVRRQRDMFAKVPKRSYSNLNRTRSGLLSQLLNPDPTIFPPNHSYRTSHSTQDMTQFARQSGHAPSPLPTSKSSAAVPVAAQITAQVPARDRSAGDNGAYRLKGRPQGEEMEEDSDSGEENPDNAIQLSRSLAQQKLAALTDPNRRRNSDHAVPTQPAVRPAIPSVATAPIPLGHPYNLPAPPPPMTPRTIRRQMLATELSESLRRNLLWERQVSKINLTNRARRGGYLGDGLRPLTAVRAEISNGSTSKNAGRGGNEGVEERSRHTMTRNRSYAADDYHYAGW